jgi:gas vesicle protein
MDKRTKRIAIGTVVAAAAGYVAGILTAPKSGKETREDIKEATSNAVAEAEKQLKKAHTELNTLLNEAKAEGAKLKGEALKDFELAASTAKTVKEKTREVLSAIHEGDANDKDLQKAINEANKAVTHLKKYITKA